MANEVGNSLSLISTDLKNGVALCYVSGVRC